MKLSPEDIATPVWQRVRAHVEAQLVLHRRALEGDRAEVDTARLRGQIKALRQVLALERPDERPVVD
ncbi:MAG: hypothetical protein V4505_00650 [Pseudomonadota bacterium]